MPFFPWLTAVVWPLVPLVAFGIGYNVGVDEHHQPPAHPPWQQGPPPAQGTPAQGPPAQGSPAQGPPGRAPTTTLPPSTQGAAPQYGQPPMLARNVPSIEQQVILQINHTGLHAQDFQRLHGLQMRVQEDGREALFFVPGDFSADGNVTGIYDAPTDGLKQGGLSFLIPGVETPVEGWWAAIPQFDEDEREDVKEAFEEIYAALVSEEQPLADEDEVEDEAERMGLMQLIAQVLDHIVQVKGAAPAA